MTYFGLHEHSQSVSPLLGLAVRSAMAAGDVIRAGAGSFSGVEQKGIGDLVSQVDLDADAAATAVIRESSDLLIMSEELNCDVAPEPEMWIIDPLDGTNAFLMQAGPQYPSVLVALRIAGETRLGVVYFPLVNELFYAERGRGAWRNGRRLICDTDDRLSSVWVEMNQYGDASLETEYFSELRNRLRSGEGARVVTSSLPYSGVAMRIAAGGTPLRAGVHDNNPASPKQATWDVAAPQVILEEAGGVFLNPRGERSDPFVCEPIIVAASKSIGDEIRGLVTPDAARHC